MKHSTILASGNNTQLSLSSVESSMYEPAGYPADSAREYRSSKLMNNSVTSYVDKQERFISNSLRQQQKNKRGKKLSASTTDQKSKNANQVSDELDERELNLLAKECLRVGYHRSEVYDPTNSFFPRAQPQKQELETLILQEARDRNPYLQNAQEIDRLLQQSDKFQRQYEENLELRKTLQANKTRYKRWQQLKQTLESSAWMRLDGDKQGRDFKRDYLTLEDQEKLLCNYKAQSAPKKYKAEHLSRTSKMQVVGQYGTVETQLKPLPPIFKSKESLYEAVSNAAMVKGLKLRLDQLRRRRELQAAGNIGQFMTEIQQDPGITGEGKTRKGNGETQEADEGSEEYYEDDEEATEQENGETLNTSKKPPVKPQFNTPRRPDEKHE